MDAFFCVTVCKEDKMALFDVVKYILVSSGELTTMKLQKLVYYSQAWSLAWDAKPLFDEEFQAWANGPVCPQLYQKHKGKFVVNADDFPEGNQNNLDEDQKETINAVISFYGDKEAQWLSDLTHMERPWIEARANTKAGERSTAIIDKSEMQDYYAGLVNN